MALKTISEKIGKLCVVGMPGFEVNEALLNRLEKRHYGGLALFGHNIKDEQQLKKIVSDLQTWYAKTYNTDLPYIISMDEEGGTLANLQQFYSEVPGNRAIGLANDPSLAFKTGKIVGSHLHEIGLSLDWAPVLDVNTNPRNPVIGIRAYGEEVGLVSAYGKAFIKGLREAGVVGTAKHFPGHGDVDTDSHVTLPLCNLPLEELYEQTLPTFQAAIDEGVGSIMVAHIKFPNIPEGNGLPASLSPFFVTELLRHRLNYQGVICTDDIEMHAILHNYEPEQIGVLAILAGIDQIIMCHGHEFQERVYQGIYDAVKAGIITEERLDESVARIEAMQKEMKTCYENAITIPKEQFKDESFKLAEQTIKVARDPQQLLPLEQKNYLLVVPVMERLTPADTSHAQQFNFDEMLTSRGLNVQTVYTSLNPTSDDIQNVLQHLDQVDAVICVTRNAHIYDGQIEISTKCSQLKPVINLVLRNPYDESILPKDSTVVLICSANDTSLEAFISIYVK